ncbi:MAG: hypothetical protein AAFR61_22910 [Bacteroidota bacterium]
MLKRSSTISTGAIALLLVIGIFSCKQETIDLLPPDEGPAITIVAPSNTNLLRQKSQPFTVTFQMADNEDLRLLRITGEVYNERDSLIGNNFQAPDVDVSGTTAMVDYTDVVPSTTKSYYKVKYTCYAIDSKGDFASTFFWVSVLPDPGEPSPFIVLEYENDSIFNNKHSGRYAFNFTARAQLPLSGSGNELDFDIKENSGTAQLIFKPRLISPNNQLLGQDSVFVFTDASRFNYEEATYTTLYEAFFSDPAPYAETPELQVGQYIIVRLTKAPQPQFAIMKINGILDDGAGIQIDDRIYFDYKVTSQQ